MKRRNYIRGTAARIKGPGTATSDSIPAFLSKGEFVIKAKSAAKIGDKALNHLNKYGKFPRRAKAKKTGLRRAL